MAWDNLKSTVAAVINTNGAQAITGNLLQSVLNSIIDQVGFNSTYKGIATTTTNPGIPDGPVFYIASSTGTYANFGGLVISENGIHILSWNGSVWSKSTALSLYSLTETDRQITGNVFNIESFAVRTNGTVTATVIGINSTPFLPITGKETIKGTGWCNTNTSDITPIAFYDINKTFLSCYTTSQGLVDYEYTPGSIPVGAAYIRCCENKLQKEGRIVGVNVGAVNEKLELVKNDIAAQAFVNLDSIVPLTGSYYTLDTALAELNTPSSKAYPYRKPGMILVFKVDYNGHEMLKFYQHIGFAHVTTYSSKFNWVDITKTGLESILNEDKFFLSPGGVVNADIGNPEDGNFSYHASYTSAIFKIKKGAKKIILNNNIIRWYAFYKDYPFMNETMIGNRGSVLPITSIPKNAKYLIVTFENSQNASGYANLDIHSVGDDVFEFLQDPGSDTLLNYESTVGGNFINASGTTTANANMNYDKYTLNPTKKYKLVASITSSGYSGFYIANYFDSTDTFLGHEVLVNLGVVSESGEVLNPPVNTSYIQVNRQTAGFSKLYEYGSTMIKSKDLKASIESIILSSNKRMKVVFNTDTSFYIRTSFDTTRDIIILYYFGETGNYNITPAYTYIGLKTDSDATILATTYVHDVWDSTGPVWMPEYWYLFAQHGYLVPMITCTHNKDASDIGSIWQDNLNRRYKLGQISGSDLYFLPEITIDGVNIGKDTRSWKAPSDNDAITGFTHVSGATHTTAISSISSKSTYQIKPIQNPENTTFTVDGNKVLDKSLIYYCDEFVASEVLSCLNPTKVTQWFPTILHEPTGYEMAHIIQSFTFVGLSCTINTVLDVKYPLNFTHYGANQARTLVPFGDYSSFAIIPKVKPLTFGGVLTDFTQPFNDSNWDSNGSVTFYRDAAYLADINNLPDRIVSWQYDQSEDEFLLGFAAGYSLTKGLTVNANRLPYIPEGTGYCNQALYFSPSNKNKFYIRAIEADAAAFTNRLLPTSFLAEINYYFSYFNPGQQPAKVYTYKDGRSYIAYIHHNQESSRLVVELPEYIEGLEATVVEKTAGANLLTTTVQNGKIYISLTNAANYLVLKF